MQTGYCIVLQCVEIIGDYGRYKGEMSVSYLHHKYYILLDSQQTQYGCKYIARKKLFTLKLLGSSQIINFSFKKEAVHSKNSLVVGRLLTSHEGYITRFMFHRFLFFLFLANEPLLAVNNEGIILPVGNSLLKF